MEQKDYLLREIEKLGIVIRAIQQKIFGGSGPPALSPERQEAEAREMLFSEMNFDLDRFLQMDLAESEKYVNGFKGFSIENIEALAAFIAKIGFSKQSEPSRTYIEKALQLFEICNMKSKTFSFERENHISALSSALAKPD
ncbi:hypothetical protein [Lentimicrobium sp.]|uniref:hypothetical protein n=1 Tax=Lentimicrobium sp. TaxID=2034841 RepID=UPI002C16FAD4|nr:hypothetical protein [Lentimicrobium sp.]HPJ63887.1 hypothetical protein [Lentimicrobium sp.]